MMQTEIPSDIPSPGPDPSMMPQMTPEQSSASFQCKLCGQTFTNQADLEQHMLVAHNQEAGAAGSSPINDVTPPAGVA